MGLRLWKKHVGWRFMNAAATEDTVEERDDIPAIENAYNAEGVDLSLIDWMLGLSPSERLDVLQDSINFYAPFQPDDTHADS